MQLVTSVIASVEHWQQVRRRHRWLLYSAVGSGVILVVIAGFMAYAELSGDPYPHTAVVVVGVLLGAAVLAGVVTISVVSGAQAVISAARVNGERIDEQTATVRRLAAERVEQIHDVAVWLQKLDFDVQRFGDLVDRAREQGRVEERDRARIRVAHLRDEHRAELEQVAREQRKLGFERGIQVGRAQQLEAEEAESTEDVAAALERVRLRLIDGG